MALREYQQRAINMLWQWFEKNPTGNPCLVLPTGAGKSHINAAICKQVLQEWPDTNILMLTHVKELIEQNALKMYEHWPNAPMGIYSASVGQKILGEPITFAGIQSIAKRVDDVGHVDLILIDECHLVGHKDGGNYRTFIAALKKINPELRVIGMTATPYRLGHGLITDKPAIFDDLIQPVSIEELVFGGFLSVLRSKITSTRYDLSAVKTRGGEYIESEMQAAVDTDDQNNNVVDEVISIAGDRKSWLFFCSGVNHARHICDILNARGIAADCVTGDTPKAEREKIISRFRSGELRALTNANVLTTGFDYPDIDLIAMLRPTKSPSLYVQMAGRGMRLKSHTDHCLVLDFARVVEEHGPITNVQPPKKAGKREGDAPVRVCPECFELCHISAKKCGSCGFEFPPPPPRKMELSGHDIMGIEGIEKEVSSWAWRKHTGKASGKEMLKVTYYLDLSDSPVSEFFPIIHEGWAGQKALRSIKDFLGNSGIFCSGLDTIPTEEILDFYLNLMERCQPPRLIEYKKDGKFYRIIRRVWGEK